MKRIKEVEGFEGDFGGSVEQETDAPKDNLKLLANCEGWHNHDRDGDQVESLRMLIFGFNMISSRMAKLILPQQTT